MSKNKFFQAIRKKNNKISDTAPTSAESLIPASAGETMLPFVEWIKTYSTLVPTNVFEIGANMAQDAEVLRSGFGLQPKDVWVFEPHPQLFAYVQTRYDFNAFDSAVLDKDGKITINAINVSKNTNSGISSVRTHKDVPEDHFDKVKVKSIRMDSFIKKHKIKSIDFVKIDVEGCNYEVLEGFGKQIDIVKCIHIEAEHYEHWTGEKLWDDLKLKLEKDFEMVFFERHVTQSDSLWIKKEYIRGAL